MIASTRIRGAQTTTVDAMSDTILKLGAFRKTGLELHMSTDVSLTGVSG